MINFKSIPFIKILLPYLLGVFFVLQFGLFQNCHLFFLMVLVFWLIAFFIQRYHKQSNAFKKWAYILLTNLLLFSLAFQAAYVYNAKNSANHYSHYISSDSQPFIARVVDIPVITPNHIKLSLQIDRIKNQNNWHYATGNTIMYLKNDSSLNFKLGNQLLVNSKFSFVNEPKNPFEFNYKAFLQNKNIFHTVYATPKQTYVIDFPSTHFSILEIGTKLKSYLVNVLRSASLSHEAFAISTALLVGYDDEIGSDIMQSFSHSGTLHILSVSGMHTGVLYAMLLFLFSLIDKQNQFKKTKFVVVVTSLWLFVFVTGLSPSVLRAALMLSVVLFGNTFYKQGNSYNTLLVSAFILLLCNPFLITDIGFLLSYFAVFGIMYFYPILAKLYVFENKILHWLWSSVLISVSATVFTLPISLYYFHQFPIWFALSNLLIIPISMAVMLGAALLMAFYKVALINQGLIYLINKSVVLMLWFAKLTDDKTYGFIDFISFTLIDVVFLTLVISFGLIIISTKRYQYVLNLGFIIIAWLALSIFTNYHHGLKNELLVFHVKQKSVYALRVGQSVYINLQSIDDKDFQRHVKPYLLTVSNLHIVSTKASVLKSANTSIVIANKISLANAPLNPNYIIVSHNTPVNLTTNYKTPPFVIADCSNSYTFVNKLKKQCRLLEIPFYSVKEEGALQVEL